MTHRINHTQLREVAHIMVQAFSLKIQYVWLFAQQKEKAVAFLERSICSGNGVYALHGERVIGFAGLNRKDNPFMVYRLKTFMACFGIWGGLWRYAVNIVSTWTDKPLASNELSIDVIAVSDQARGQGLGTTLLEQVFEVARQEDKQAVLLEVVDTNPKAQALYEKKGFVVTHIDQLGKWTHKAGFTSVAHMRKTIAPLA